MYKFCWVTLNVLDIERSVAFYNGLLGLPISSKSISDDTSLAMLGADDTPKVEVISHKGLTIDNPGNGVSVGFEVDSLKDTMQKLKANGVPILSGIISPGPHISFFFAADPDGYRVQFIEYK